MNGPSSSTPRPRRSSPSIREWLIDLPDGADPDAIVAATYQENGEVQEISLASRSSGLLAVGGDSTSPTVLVFGALALLEACADRLCRVRGEHPPASARARPPCRGRRNLATARRVRSSPRRRCSALFASAGGVIAGVLIALGISPFLDELTGHREGPLVLDAVGLVGPVIIGFAAAMLAAYAPARSVARLPVLRALSGRRPPEAPARRDADHRARVDRHLGRDDAAWCDGPVRRLAAEHDPAHGRRRSRHAGVRRLRAVAARAPRGHRRAAAARRPHRVPRHRASAVAQQPDRHGDPCRPRSIDRDRGLAGQQRGLGAPRTGPRRCTTTSWCCSGPERRPPARSSCRPRASSAAGPIPTLVPEGARPVRTATDSLAPCIRTDAS